MKHQVAAYLSGPVRQTLWPVIIAGTQQDLGRVQGASRQYDHPRPQFDRLSTMHGANAPDPGSVGVQCQYFAFIENLAIWIE